MEKKTQKKIEESGEKTDENGCRYVIASSRRPERRLLERRMLVPKVVEIHTYMCLGAIIMATKGGPSSPLKGDMYG